MVTVKVENVVQYTLPAGNPNAGEARPAIVSRVTNQLDAATQPGLVNLVVFAGDPADFGGAATSLVTGVLYDATGGQGTWKFGS